MAHLEIITNSLTRHRSAFWLGFYGAILAAWAGLFWASASPLPGVSAAEYWASLCLGAGDAPFASLFGMWSLMTAAMMLPSFAPAVRVFDEVSGLGASDGRGMAALVGGYSIVWLGFSFVAAMMQSQIGRLDLPVEVATLATAGLFLLAGAYQFSTLKAACLAKCRHPLLFFMEHWKPGAGTAFQMGLRLGAYCLGCCWVLMLLGFVGGAMNLLWMGAATLFMAIEKLPRPGRFLTKPAGYGLLIAGGVTLARASTLI